ncbi:4-hydroxythreonine-4-phosphate dehydrogenase PdxA [Pedobacter heparinus]|uniref:4-hydroxythreonine-4-phosphate dehydrogenase n=1 Tax=Pedobacter heparinus (strain ATCC 13125 / DSM 2366 / CIP 104194 / JCM 7457 / NBRC 12017 / NCIMB 9290 / NRRL B-14731 / HIM 762-3) TaxID=485917 RepID=C6Y0I6_PEDHD|nr:4-hydroxythreonine-4-phosphate dehydrogenase PdxA [Pedobacter heparinus]ACU02747.1 4-hydroxythreonine-4-phosphate dehydrogenase [Pedobacter heparinus DSM 2366]
MKTNNKKPILGITMGDPASIGPEVAVKALANAGIYEICKPLLVGDAEICKDAIRFCGLDLVVNAVKDVKDAKFEFGSIDVYDLEYASADIVTGQNSVAAGAAAFNTVVKVIDLAMKGLVDATVTGPINKESIHLAGHKFSGHTEIYAHYTDTKKYGMLLVEDDLRVIHVSTHVSLRQACDLVKKQRILDTIELIVSACRQLGISNPKIGVAGLNPHASDGGLFGEEEQLEIIPAIEEARRRGYTVEGPVPADTLFPKAIGGVYDGIVAMYHDQGHIPFKVVGFNWDKSARQMKSVRGVNITLGLPIIRTSVDHGTAMEIAGRGIASADAMNLAIEYAVNMVRTK